MSHTTSARLGLPYLAAGQMQKHVTLNQALTRLDGLVQCVIESRSVMEQPAAPADGVLYILPEGAEGAAWSAHAAGTLVRAEGGGWAVMPVPEGMLALIRDARELRVRDGGDWVPLAAWLGAFQNLERLGLSATADAYNPFIARLNSALWMARDEGDGGTGDLRMVLNKTGADRVVSLILQSAWSGRAELGLIGEDDFGLKVSADGSAWTEALRVEAGTGRVRFPLGACRREETVFASDGSWSVPAWAQWVEVLAVGGGGGGGGGTSGAPGTLRPGGGGGGSGSVQRAVWSSSALGGGLTVTVGAGGGGGGSGLDGENGGFSRLALGGAPLLTADGGVGGRADGAAGEGGCEGPFNAGGVGGGVEPARSGGERTGDAPGGGGGGGGLNTANTVLAAAMGGAGARCGSVAEGGVAGMASGGGTGGAAAHPGLGRMGGGGGGGSASAASGYAGGAGGGHGAGGGGGGAGSVSGGTGGQGAAGVVVLVAVG